MTDTKFNVGSTDNGFNIFHCQCWLSSIESPGISACLQSLFS